MSCHEKENLRNVDTSKVTVTKTKETGKSIQNVKYVFDDKSMWRESVENGAR